MKEYVLMRVLRDYLVLVQTDKEMGTGVFNGREKDAEWVKWYIEKVEEREARKRMNTF